MYALIVYMRELFIELARSRPSQAGPVNLGSSIQSCAVHVTEDADF
jgi:hypothetical protein